MTTLTLVIPGRPMSSNDRTHWRARAEHTAVLRDAALLWAIHTWGPQPPTLTYPARVTVQHHCKTARLADVGNCQPAVKAVIDGLTDYTLWPDDGPAHVGALVFLPPVKTGVDELVLIITDETTP